jgi:hypothetical protein
MLHYGFDGWFVNVEHPLDAAAGQPAALVALVAQLTAAVHAAHPDGVVLWCVAGMCVRACARHEGTHGHCAHTCGRYDSVTQDGVLDWQNGVTTANARFLDACDGLFTNYTWRTEQPLASAARAGARRWDVYTGVDVFGRGTYGGGGWAVHAVRYTRFSVLLAHWPYGVCVPLPFIHGLRRVSVSVWGGAGWGGQALDVIAEAGTSVALFAPGWTWEVEAGHGGRPPLPLAEPPPPCCRCRGDARARTTMAGAAHVLHQFLPGPWPASLHSRT